MTTESIRISEILPAPPERIYEAWLSSKEHSAFTGTACVVEPIIYGRHSEGDGYIEGVTLEFDRGRRIVQTWRSSDFPKGSPDSQLEVLLEPVDGGTEITLVHTDIPAGQGGKYQDGWRQLYLEPMKRYFAGAGRGAAKKGKGKRAAGAKGRTAKAGAARRRATKRGASGGKKVARRAKKPVARRAKKAGGRAKGTKRKASKRPARKK